MVEKPRSLVPMILGVIGGVIGLPSALCAGACAVGVSSLGGKNNYEAQSAGDLFLYLGLIAALGGLVLGLMARRKPVLGGTGMIVFGILSLLTLFTGNLLAIVPSICFLLGGLIALLNRNRLSPDM